MIKVELSKTELRGGEKLSGRAVWNGESTKNARKILVEVRRVISGRGVKLEEIVDSTTKLDVPSGSQVTVPFEFEIPGLGPPTHDGKLLSISWNVTARVDLPFAIDEVESATVIVRPQIWSPEQFREFDQFDEDDLDDEDLEEDTELQ